MEQQPSPDDFASVGKGPTEEVSIEELDTALKFLRSSEAEYQAAKKVSGEKYGVFATSKEKFISLLKAAGKDRWECEGVNGFTMYDELKFRVPDGPDAKEEFFNFIQSSQVSELLGQDPRDIFLKYATVNAQSLGPLCKLIKKEAATKGLDIQVAGVRPPTTEARIRSIPKKKGK